MEGRGVQPRALSGHQSHREHRPGMKHRSRLACRCLCLVVLGNKLSARREVSEDDIARVVKQRVVNAGPVAGRKVLRD